MRNALRTQHYSIRMENVFIEWVSTSSFSRIGAIPKDMTPEVEAFLIHLAIGENAAVSAQNQALVALLFLYCQAHTMRIAI